MNDDTKTDGWKGVIRGRPEPGAVATRSRTTRMQDIHAFTEMTGDRKTLLYDEALARRSVFG